MPILSFWSVLNGSLCKLFFFHLSEPPLSSRNIPSGKWLCNNCRKEAPSASEDHNDEVVDPIRRSLNILIEAIAQENPSQFELPYKLIPSDQFPGKSFSELSTICSVRLYF